MEQLDTNKPLFLKSENDAKDFLSKNPHVQLVDAFSRQLKELFFIDKNKFIGEDKEKTYRTEEFKNYCLKKANDFIHVYFPWNFHLVKTIKQDDYFRLKTNRNQDLITAAEQIKLRDYRVGVFGMSVGSNIAFVLTQAGISNKIIIADFDELDTSNLNRILGGVHQIGLNKTHMAARRIYEGNPFTEVKALSEGITKENLEGLLKNRELDLIVEEIDDIKVKIETRILAMKYKVPVVMITDNGESAMLHIERYDLGHDKIFDKDLSYWQTKIHENMTKTELGMIIEQDIFGGREKIEPKMIESVMKVFKKELVSWSQLGSAAILGAVIATITVKKVVLENHSGINVKEFISVKNF